MTLLSGGEQALTAIALIFAVFLTNPSPICVLDEVDAPLDDANVERYCDLLDAMARETETRFVVITHNPITMARMNRLFGVTMAERGVSQLVSVDLEGASASSKRCEASARRAPFKLLSRAKSDTYLRYFHVLDTLVPRNYGAPGFGGRFRPASLSTLRVSP
jgi:ABC-type multidrug transport system ATPase subunit